MVTLVTNFLLMPVIMPAWIIDLFGQGCNESSGEAYWSQGSAISAKSSELKLFNITGQLPPSLFTDALAGGSAPLDT
jgi:hypothetical protein